MKTNREKENHGVLGKRKEGRTRALRLLSQKKRENARRNRAIDKKEGLKRHFLGRGRGGGRPTFFDSEERRRERGGKNTAASYIIARRGLKSLAREKKIEVGTPREASFAPN